MRANTFTTYFNVENDPGIQQTVDRQTKIVTSGYDKITASAIAATRATAGLLGGTERQA